MQQHNTTLIENSQIALRRANLEDAVFILQLLNQTSFINNIRDKGIRTIEDAQSHIEQSFLIPYQIGAVAPFVVVEQGTNQAIGICGLYQRPFLTCPDIGYAFLDDYTGRGLAYQSAALLIEFLKTQNEVSQLSAITLNSNKPSINLLSRLGFSRVGELIIDAHLKPVQLFVLAL
ncbi:MULTISPECIES: GNAT family N-acetyltransferase [unclassified Pseudoalteromonas]|uniref:GNAT family N-acetyltransferase n=1 Tax=unclassified Pseudoalteromonas TaxID=194690 RepID=UPI0030151807